MLAVSAAAVGLLVIDWLPSLLPSRIAASLPYWIDLGGTRGTGVWALSLAVLSAVVAGVVPALKVTGKTVQRNMQRAAAGRSGIRLHGMSSPLIVADVAIAVAVVGFVAGMSSYLREAREARLPGRRPTSADESNQRRRERRAGTAASTRRIRSPRCTASKPSPSKVSISKSLNPPSGPTARVIGRPTCLGHSIAAPG